MDNEILTNTTENPNPDTAGAGRATASSPSFPPPALAATPFERPAPNTINPTPPIPPIPPAAPPTEFAELVNPNRPRNNIARLPVHIREIINQALREGEEYHVIIARVQHLFGKHHGVYPSNLSSWYRTGYRDWLRQKTHLEDTLAQNDAALSQLCRLKNETGADLPDLIETFLASLLQKTLRDFDPASLNTLLAEKPAEIFRLIACLNSHIAAKSRHKTAEVARVRCQVDVAEKAQSTHHEPVPVHNLWEAALVQKAFGTPFEQITHAFDKYKPASEKEPKKRRKNPRPASSTPQNEEAP